MMSEWDGLTEIESDCKALAYPGGEIKIAVIAIGASYRQLNLFKSGLKHYQREDAAAKAWEDRLLAIKFPIPVQSFSWLLPNRDIVWDEPNPNEIFERIKNYGDEFFSYLGLGSGQLEVFSCFLKGCPDLPNGIVVDSDDFSLDVNHPTAENFAQVEADRILFHLKCARSLSVDELEVEVSLMNNAPLLHDLWP